MTSPSRRSIECEKREDSAAEHCGRGSESSIVASRFPQQNGGCCNPSLSGGDTDDRPAGRRVSQGPPGAICVHPRRRRGSFPPWRGAGGLPPISEALPDAVVPRHWPESLWSSRRSLGGMLNRRVRRGRRGTSQWFCSFSAFSAVRSPETEGLPDATALAADRSLGHTRWVTLPSSARVWPTAVRRWP